MNPFLYDWDLFGALMKLERKKLFITSTAELSEEIYLNTRKRISKDTLYRIEQGKQVPNAEQFMAINLTLFGSLIPGEFSNMHTCLSEEWRECAGGGTIPEQWRKENILEAYRKSGFVSDTGLRVVDAAGTCPRMDSLLVDEDYLPSCDYFAVYVDEEERGIVFAQSGDFYFSDSRLSFEFIHEDLPECLPSEHCLVIEGNDLDIQH